MATIQPSYIGLDDESWVLGLFVQAHGWKVVLSDLRATVAVFQIGDSVSHQSVSNDGWAAIIFGFSDEDRRLEILSATGAVTRITDRALLRGLSWTHFPEPGVCELKYADDSRRRIVV